MRQPADGEPVDAAVLCAHAGLDGALAALEPGGTLLLFSWLVDPAAVDFEAVLRRELTLVGSCSATPAAMRDAIALLPELDPIPTVTLPLERFTEGLELYRSHEAVKVVFAAVRALLYHGPCDLRVEEVPRPDPGPGDVLVQVEVALTDGTDAKAFRRGHPLLLAELPSPFGHEFCGVDVATGAAWRQLGAVRRLRTAARRRSARTSSRS